MTLPCVNIIVFYSCLPYSYPPNAPFPHQLLSSSKRVPLGFHVTYVFGELCLDQDSAGEKKNIKIWSYQPLLFHHPLVCKTPSVPSESPSPSISYIHIFFLNLDPACKEKHRMIFVFLDLMISSPLLQLM